VVVDEAQDVTPLLFGFVCRLLAELRARGRQPQLVVLGDPRQAIYEFKGSDARYLTLAPRVWPVTGAWATCHLRTSYRVSPAVADFVNQCMLGERWMDAAPGKPYGEPVHYWVGSAYSVVKSWAAEIHDLVFNQGVRPDEIFVLAPSVRAPKPGIKDTPLMVLLRELLPVEPIAGRTPLPVYHPASDDAPLNSDSVALGSLVVSTYHQSKGLERPYVYALGWGGDWFQHIGRNVPVAERVRCTNEHYTCATRAITRLSVCAEVEPDGYLPFIKRSRLF
jgi:superfamily I DNA/RNA helicase